MTMTVANMKNSIASIPGTINRTKPTPMASPTRIDAARNFQNPCGCHSTDRSTASGLSWAARKKAVTPMPTKVLSARLTRPPITDSSSAEEPSAESMPFEIAPTTP